MSAGSGLPALPAGLSFSIVLAENSVGWAALAAVADNAFFAPAFVLPAARAFGAALSVAVLRQGEEVVAALPFVRARLGRIAPAMQAFAHDYAPLGTPLVHPAWVDRGTELLLSRLALSRRGAALVLPWMPLHHPVAEALRRAANAGGRAVAVLARHQRAVVTLGREEGLRASLATRRRKELARQLRRLGDEGAVSFRAFRGSDVPVAFSAFLALEKRGWKGSAGTAMAALPAVSSFAHEAVAAFARDDRIRIDGLFVGENPVAMLVTFLTQTAGFTWKIAYNEAFSRYSPGAQLMLEVPARIFADHSVRSIDSLATADHPMIDRLWPERMQLGTLVVAPPGGGLLFRAGLAAARGELAAREKARQLLRR